VKKFLPCLLQTRLSLQKYIAKSTCSYWEGQLSFKKLLDSHQTQPKISFIAFDIAAIRQFLAMGFC